MAPQPLSEFARRYGPRDNTANSGLTPTEYSFPRHITNEEAEIIEDREEFQRERLHGFTTKELMALDAISDRKLKEGNLRNKIHPIMTRDRWENVPPSSFGRTALYPVESGTGLWSSDNNEVWRVLQPSLKLASRILLSSHMLGWFHALLDGKRRPIAANRCEPGRAAGLFSYHASPAMDRKETSILRDKALEKLCTKWNLQFGFLKPKVDPTLPDVNGPDFDPDFNAVGLTWANFDEMERDASKRLTWRIFCFIGYWPLELLMRNDLTSAQRLQLEWYISVIIIHEVGHALDYASAKDRPHHPEPYFEDNAIAEVGYDVEVAVFGGIPNPMIYQSGYLPLGFWLHTKYPSYANVRKVCPDAEILTRPAPFDHQISYPIPVTFFEDVQQEEFWDIGVTKFGYPLPSYRSPEEGAQVDYKAASSPKPGKFKHEVTSTTRVRGQNPFPRQLVKLRNEVSRLATMICLTPHQISVRSFGQAILTNHKTEKAFWAGFVNQEDAVQKIIDIRSKTPKNVQRRTDAIASITDLVSQLIGWHENMIKSISTLEETNGTRYTDRRRRLVVWNRGMREFIRQFQKTLDKNTHRAYLVSLEDGFVAFVDAYLLLDGQMPR